MRNNTIVKGKTMKLNILMLDIKSTDLDINIIVCFFCQLYEDCKEG